MLSKIKGYTDYLISEEKSTSTIHKYIHDITEFVKWLAGKEISKELTIEYKQILMEQYTVKTVNSVISSLNSFFIWLDCPECKVKNVRVQKTTFTAPNRDLTMDEYERLLKTAYNLGKERLYLVMQTICATGIRVSELCYITVEAVRNGAA